MIRPLSRRALLAAPLACALTAAARPGKPGAMQAVVDYVRSQKTTGFLVIQDGGTVVEENWPAPPESAFRNFLYEKTPEGSLLEDVASQQKSFASMLVAMAMDRGLLELSQPVSEIIGPGWSKATRDQEARIRVLDLLTMSTGLGPDFSYQAPPGTVFFYNTPVYAVTLRVLTAASRQALESLTHEWLTGPAGMTHTSWRQRPAAFGDVGNPNALVTSPRDTARFGQIVLDRGKSATGTRLVSEERLLAMFSRSPANPAYGRLWWLNGSPYTIKPLAERISGPLIPAAPAGLVAALGALDRKLYIVPGQQLLAVRMGAAAPDKDFDQQLWLRLAAALHL